MTGCVVFTPHSFQIKSVGTTEKDEERCRHRKGGGPQDSIIQERERERENDRTRDRESKRDLLYLFSKQDSILCSRVPLLL